MRTLAAIVCLLGTWFAVVPQLAAQAAYTATRRARLQLGGGGLYLKTDYSPRASQGGAIWADLDVSNHLGIEGAVHFGGLRAPDGIAERSYVVGPRVFIERKKLTLFATAGVGQGTISDRHYGSSSTYNLVNFGAGLEYRIKRRLNVRLGDVQMQHWLSFEADGLSPFSVIAGVSYVLP